jgi:hypothetical protein
MWWNGETMTTKLSFACFLGFCLEELLKIKKKKSVSMPGNADRGLNRGHCQFAAKKVRAML